MEDTPKHASGRTTREDRAVTTSSVGIEDLHPELSSRVRAATTNADYRLIRRVVDDDGGVRYEVSALSGDRVVLMHLAMRDDASVHEETSTFLAGDASVIEIGPEVAIVEATVDGELRTLTVPAALGERLAASADG